MTLRLLQKYPSGKGTPLLKEQAAKAARGFKSLLLRHMILSFNGQDVSLLH